MPGLPLVFLDFAEGGNAGAFLDDGWSQAEPLGRWNDGPACTIALPSVPYEGPLQLVVSAYALHEPPKTTWQRLLVSLNGTPLRSVQLRGDLGTTALVWQIPDGIIRPDAASTIEFGFPDARRIATDSRRLAIHFRFLVLEPPRPDGGHSLTDAHLELIDRRRNRLAAAYEQVRSAVLAAEAIDPARALQLCRAWANAFPYRTEPHRIASDLLFQLFRPAEAIAAINRAAAADPGEFMLQLTCAGVAEVWQEYDRAARELRKITRKAPDFQWAWYMLASAYAALDWLDQAMSCTARVRALGATGPDPRREAEQIERRFGAVRNRLAEQLRRRKSQPPNADQTVALAEDLTRTGWPRTALRLLTGDAGVSCSSALPYRAMAKAVRRSHSLAQAIEIAAIPARLGVWERAHEYFRADLLRQAGRHDEAAGILQGLARADPAPHVMDLLCRSLFVCRRFTDVERTYNEWAPRQPNVSPPSQWMLSTLAAAGRVRVIQRIAKDRSPEAGDARIPRVVFQYWNDSRPPADVAALMQTWAAQNDGFDHVVFDRAAARDFLQRSYPADVLAAFEKCPHPAMEADLIRLAFLAANGGVYADADERCLAPLERLFAALDGASFAAAITEGIPLYVHNWFICAAPANGIVRLALEQAVRMIHLDENERGTDDLWQITGPGLLTRCCVTQALAEIRAGRAADMALISQRCYTAIAASEDELAYKSGTGNWRDFRAAK